MYGKILECILIMQKIRKLAFTGRPHKNVEESKNVITYDINSEKLTEEQKEVPRIWNRSEYK